MYIKNLTVQYIYEVEASLGLHMLPLIRYMSRLMVKNSISFCTAAYMFILVMSTNTVYRLRVQRGF